MINSSEKSFAVEARLLNFYDGSDIEWGEECKSLFCLNGNEVALVDVATSQILQSYKTSNSNGKDDVTDASEDDSDTIYCFSLTKDYVVTAHQSGLLRLWDIKTNQILKIWKSQHKGPVIEIVFSPYKQIICSSGGDSTLRLWNFYKKSCLCVLKGFTGPAQLIKFHPNVLQSEIYAVGADNSIYCWNYETKELVRHLRAHLSQVTDMCFQTTSDQYTIFLATVSRDKMLIVWKLCKDSSEQIKNLPLYEELVGVTFLNGHKYIIVAMSNGKLEAVNVETSEVSNVLSESDQVISKMIYSHDYGFLAIITSEQNILIYKIHNESNILIDIEEEKQLIGYNDQILDMCFLGAEDRYMAVATNSKHFKLYDANDKMNCKLIKGHTDTVMTLSATKNLLLSTGKDKAIIVWQLLHDKFGLQCLLQQANCHTATIGCIAFASNAIDNFATVSQDGSLKVWKLRNVKSNRKYTLAVRYAALAHSKEVNSVTFSPNNKIIATASQDKTAKLWLHNKNTTIATLRGHTRGVWCVRFSPVDQIVLTSSSDCSLRIWSIANFTCLKRLEQECTVLRAEFFDHGKYIVSSGSDGIVKIWSVKNNACAQTIDEHNDRVWSICVPTHSNKYFYTGGADSKIIKFIDFTEAKKKEALDKNQATLEQEQTLQILLHQRQSLQKAFMLALSLGKPKATYDIIKHYVRKRDTPALKSMINHLNEDQKLTLLEHVKAWCTNSRHLQISNIILQQIIGEAFTVSQSNIYKNGNLIEVLSPYIQRHFKRYTELNKDLAFLEFMLKSM